MRIIAADDEPLALKLLLQSITDACPQALLRGFQKPTDVLTYLQTEECDVAFLDIRMRGMDGLTLAQRVKECCPRCNIIFVTGYSEYATDALSLHASGYLLKPINAEKIRRELEDLRHPVQSLPQALLRISCFGNFQVSTPEGGPIRFSRAKSRELFAYLVYRRGGSCTTRELAAVLFEDREYSERQMTYLQKIVSSMMQTLREWGAESVISKSYNAISLNTHLVDCDYYRFLQKDPAAVHAYAGEFMAQYSWAEFVAGYLDRVTQESALSPQ